MANQQQCDHAPDGRITMHWPREITRSAHCRVFVRAQWVLQGLYHRWRLPVPLPVPLTPPRPPPPRPPPSSSLRPARPSATAPARAERQQACQWFVRARWAAARGACCTNPAHPALLGPWCRGACRPEHGTAAGSGLQCVRQSASASARASKHWTSAWPACTYTRRTLGASLGAGLG